MRHQLFSNKLYDKINGILEQHDLRNHHKSHTTAKLIEAMTDELDKGGWVKLPKSDDINDRRVQSLEELIILVEAEQKAFDEVRRLRHKNRMAKGTTQTPLKSSKAN
jgi:hypothetical protein